MYIHSLTAVLGLEYHPFQSVMCENYTLIEILHVGISVLNQV